MDDDQDLETGQQAISINQMSKMTKERRDKLEKQVDVYKDLFELVPCIITVQDRNYKLLRYNREFSVRFDPTPGDYCYNAYKGRSEKCLSCPVEKTFEDGMSHWSEESGLNKDGTQAHWVVKTSPIKNSDGEVVAAMEMCLDITHMKQLEEKLKISEKRYHAIFNNIPNPVFVLDPDTFEILDCNDSVQATYGYSKDEIIEESFLDLFREEERDQYASRLRTSGVINRAKHLCKDGRALFVVIRISPSEYDGQKVLLVTTSDITKHLEAEQLLIQASKMATLGEMATGVAHELNQPLSVIKTASSFLKKKVKKKEAIQDEILETLAEEIDSHVDRASKIINHMREFGRKSEVKKEKVQVNRPFNNAIEIFNQQLRLREIEVVKELEEDLPPVLADTNRLEQIFVNLLINARDAIEVKWEKDDHPGQSKKISLKTSLKNGMVTVEIRDTGAGIPKSVLDKIFEPFFTTKKVGRGTGLGLSISYGIVKDYDGVIKVETEEGRGSNFIVQFPVAGKA